MKRALIGLLLLATVAGWLAYDAKRTAELNARIYDSEQDEAEDAALPTGADAVPGQGVDDG